MSDKSGTKSKKVRTIDPSGQLRVVAGTKHEEAPSAAKKVADKLHVEYQDGADNGNLTTREAGKIGGHLGGPMVRKLVYLAKQELANQHVDDLIERNKK